MINDAKIALGKSLNKGPANKSTQSNIKTETTEVMWVRPPALTWTIVRDMEAVIGKDWKKDPNTLEAPMAINSWLGSIGRVKH